MVAGVSNPADLAVVPVHALTLAGQLVATAGSWTLEAGAARFTPLFPPVPATVHAVVALTGPGWTELCRVSVPAVELEPSTRVDSIDPGGDHLPANVLRISVTFSAPMEQGGASDRFHLLAEDGGELIGTCCRCRRSCGIGPAVDSPCSWNRDASNGGYNRTSRPGRRSCLAPR